MTVKYKATITITDTEQGCRIESVVMPAPKPADTNFSPALAMNALMMEAARKLKQPKKAKPRG